MRATLLVLLPLNSGIMNVLFVAEQAFEFSSSQIWDYECPPSC